MRKRRYNYPDWNVTRTDTLCMQTTKIKIIFFLLMKYSDLERQKVGRKGLRVWQLFKRQANVFTLPTYAFEKSFWTCGFCLIHMYWFSCCFLLWAQRKSEEKTWKLLSLLSRESTLWFKVIALFKAKITDSAYGIRDDEKN